MLIKLTSKGQVNGRHEGCEGFDFEAGERLNEEGSPDGLALDAGSKFSQARSDPPVVKTANNSA